MTNFSIFRSLRRNLSPLTGTSMSLAETLMWGSESLTAISPLQFEAAALYPASERLLGEPDEGSDIGDSMTDRDDHVCGWRSVWG
jgi:environmental stress-induced protein Ves